MIKIRKTKQIFGQAINNRETDWPSPGSPFLESDRKKPLCKEATQNTEVQFFDIETDDSWASKIRKSLVIS